MSQTVELQRARQRARRVYRSEQFQGAYVNGARAALAGRPDDSCPYPRDARQTWRRAWRSAWLLGYHSIQRDEED